jgi:hypothetical protein
VAPRGFEQHEGAVDIGAVVGVRLADRRHDVGTRREMENALDAIGGAPNRGRVGDVALDDLDPGIAVVLAQVLAPADHETVEHAHRTAIRDQAIDQMASDEARSAGDKIDAQYATPAFRIRGFGWL